MLPVRVFEQTIMIRFEDADPAGIVFYPRAIALAQGVIEEMIRHSPLGWKAWFASPEYVMPVRQAEANFLEPMAVGNFYTVKVQVERLGETSVTFLVEFRDAAQRLTARIRSVHVLVGKITGRPMRLTPEMRDALT